MMVLNLGGLDLMNKYSTSTKCNFENHKFTLITLMNYKVAKLLNLSRLKFNLTNQLLENTLSGEQGTH